MAHDTIHLKILFPDSEHRFGLYKVLRFDTGMTIAQATQLIAERLETSPASHALFDPHSAVWMDPNRTIAEYGLGNQAEVKFMQRPDAVKFVVEGHEHVVFASFELPLGEVIRDNHMVKNLAKCKIIYGDRVLEPNLSLHDQQVPKDATILVQNARKPSLVRPTRPSLASLGVKEKDKPHGVFGASLAHVMAATPGAEVPLIVGKCIDYIETKALQVEGVFRLSGSAVEIQKYKKAFDKGHDDVNLHSCPDPHVVAGLLKLYLRELPEPLLTFELYHVFYLVPRIRDHVTRTKFMQYLVGLLPRHSHALLRAVVNLLQHVAMYEQVNRMGIPSLATVLAPNILRSSDDSTMSMVMDTPVINALASLLIEDYHEIFEGSASEAPHYIAAGTAAYDYTAAAMNQVSFQIGQVVLVVSKQEDGWLLGAVEGQMGVVPANYVEIVWATE